MTLCTLFQPLVSSLQYLLNLLYVPLSFLGISAPPVATWFNPILQPIFGCTVS